ncbi:hypothetical protein [Paenibacillus sp. JJ-223]|uniref:hypothetical protein n=1 Tax=Paenibacillus sp. JJ-223 TaxID=2905647 RepID=UPI001F207F51|nr:hypothetical protein [Paenibacillus sp. JJ-223]CAH1225210.1 hypothetical protein PAECIP111890_05765 [Paenibacillus sp. JJ-223]
MRRLQQQDRNQRVLDLAYNFNDQLVRRRELSSGEEETYTYREDGLLISSANNEVLTTTTITKMVCSRPNLRVSSVYGQRMRHHVPYCATNMSVA